MNTVTRPNASPKVQRWAYFLQLVSLIAGISISLYLLVQHTRLEAGIQVTPSFCSFGAHVDCDAVNISKYSTLLRIPLASYGAIFYFILLLCSCLSSPKGKNALYFQRWLARLALVGIIFDIILLLVQIFALKTFCIMCLLTYVCSFIAFVTSIAMQRGKIDLSPRGISQSVLGSGSPSSAPVAPGVWILSVVAILAMMGVVACVPLIVNSKNESHANVENALEQYFNEWKTRPTRRFDVSPDDATYGNSMAKIQIVEFSDFECPHCKHAAFTIQKILKLYGDRIYFIFKNFPLDSSCNPDVSVQMHQHACALAKLATCAVRKGLFWSFNDAVFFEWASDSPKPADSVAQAVKSGPFKPFFTEAEYRACVTGDMATKKVLEDIKMAHGLLVSATPTLFINGKQLDIPATFENLQRIIEIESKL